MSEPVIIPKHFPTLAEIEQAKSLAPDMDPMAHYVLNVLLRVTRRLEVSLDKNMMDYGLSMGRYVVLAKIYQSGRKGISASALADSLGVTRATMTGLLDSLERDEFISRVRREDDKRRLDICATPKAKKHLAKIVPDHCDRVGETFSIFTDKEMQSFVDFPFKLDASLAPLTRAKPAKTNKPRSQSKRSSASR